MTLALAAALLIPIHASVTVRVVHDAAPVPNATVTGAGISATTDSRGEARLALSQGRNTIEVARPGFAPASATVDVIEEQEATVLVQLRALEHPTEVVVVTATRSGRVVEDQPIRVETVPAEEIEENSTVAPGNLTTLLEELAGIRSESTAPSLGAGRLRVRGLDGRFTQILSDELPLWGEQPDGLALLQTPPLDLAHVEVIKGAASALYGPAALGGVVNLVSRRPDGEPSLLLSRSSEEETDLVGFLPLASTGAWSGTILAGVHRRPMGDVDGDGWADLSGYRRAVLRPRLYWDDGRGRAVLATIGAIGESREGGTVSGATVPDGAPFRDAMRTRRFDAGSAGRFLLEGRRVVTFHASLVDDDRERSIEDVPETTRRTFAFSEVSLAGAGARHNWLAGLALQYDDSRFPELPRFDESRLTSAVFAQEEIDVSSRFIVSASGRVDHDASYGTFFSPRVSALLRAGSGWSLRWSAGSGWAPPTPFVAETEAAGLSRLVALDGVRPETAGTASMDAGWSNGTFEVNGSLFASEVRRPLVYRDIADTPGAFEIVNADAPTHAWGTELLLRIVRGPLQAIVSHTFVSATEAEPRGGGRRDVPLVPRHAAEVAAIWEREDKGRIGCEVAYTGHQALADDPYRDESPSLVEINVLGEIRFGEIGLFVNALNLTDERQTKVDPLLLPERSADGRWTTDAWGPLAGRTFLVGVRWEM